MRLGHVEIPGAGCRGVVTVTDGENGVYVVHVDIYPPTKKDPIRLPGSYFPGPYESADVARSSISKDLNDIPVGVSHV